jgi:hypothetical protein
VVLSPEPALDPSGGSMYGGGVEVGEMQIKKYRKKVRLAERIWERVYQHVVFEFYIIGILLTKHSLEDIITL